MILKIGGYNRFLLTNDEPFRIVVKSMDFVDREMWICILALLLRCAEPFLLAG